MTEDSVLGRDGPRGPAAPASPAAAGLADGFIGGVAVVSRLVGFAAAGLIVVSVVVICQMLFVRFVLNQQTIWQTDFVTYSLVASTFIGSPYVLLTRGHVNVDVLPHYLGTRARYWLALVAAVLSLAFCLVLAVLGAGYFHEAWSQNWRSDSLWRVRLWIPYLSMPIGLGILSLQYVADLLALVTGQAAPFGMAAGDRR